MQPKQVLDYMFASAPADQAGSEAMEATQAFAAAMQTRSVDCSETWHDPS